MTTRFNGDVLPHQPVLYKEIISALQPRPGGRYVDGTVGAGGHASGILEASRPDGSLLGLDVDPHAVALAKSRLAAFGKRVHLFRASYLDMEAQLHKLRWVGADGILLDLGVSSMQLDQPERGFSFQSDAPLDMRFDTTKGQTAADLVNDMQEADLANLIYLYGEERRSRRVASAIVQARPILTTRQLAEAVRKAVGGVRGRIDPATRTFQALRIAVNDELGSIEKVLPMALRLLLPGGRLAVVAFHSLEDRLVKQCFHLESQDCICPPGQPVCTCGHQRTIRELTRRPIQAGEAELLLNPRARSARLRVAEKI